MATRTQHPFIGFGGVPVGRVVGAGVEIAGSPQGSPITSLTCQELFLRKG